VKPGLTEAMQLAMQHHQAGRLSEAEALYREVLAYDPNHGDAWHLLGTLALQVEQYELAEDLIRRAIAIKGDWPQACYHLGLSLAGKAQFDAAIAAHRRATALDPGLATAHYHLGFCLQAAGYRDKAIAAYRQAIALNENDPYARANLAIALQGTGRLDEAIATLRHAVKVKPDFADGFSHLGKALRENGMLDEAIAAFGQAVGLRPRDHELLVNLAEALWEAGRIEEAVAEQRQAVALQPDDANAHWAYGLLLLLNGDFAAGWPEFEWRWRRKTLPWPRRKLQQPLWDGSALAGRTIYLHAEKSFGDTIQFIRYVPIIQRLGGKTIVECQPGLRRLLAANMAVEKWLVPSEPLPPRDVYCPLLSLPLLLHTTRDTIPAEHSYLHVAAEWSQAWQQRVPGSSRLLKVGLAWAGKPSEIHDRKRSLPLSQLAPLAHVRGVLYFSLQKGQAAAEAHDPAAAVEMLDFGDAIADFADTAGLISQLDLVVTVDTAVAHLAGALGKPVWTLLPFVPDWRWGRAGESTPWYPTMRLFRQQSRGDWAEVVRRVTDELTQVAAARLSK
jgi:tetratricopeptide (TPR) repeat protein